MFPKHSIFGNQKGVSLTIAFLVLTIMLAIVLSASSILYSQVKIVSNIGNSVVSFFAAESGSEEVFYFDRKQISNGASRGFCSICTTCNLTGCTECTATSLADGEVNGCDISSCNNCRVNYTSTIDGKPYLIDAKVSPSPQDPSLIILTVKVKGFYNGTARSIQTSNTFQSAQ
jgi:Tfp pilus assembly protein PilX